MSVDAVRTADITMTVDVVLTADIITMSVDVVFVLQI